MDPTTRVARRFGLVLLALAAIATTSPAPALGADRRSAIIEGKEVRRSSINLRATYDVDATISWAGRSITARTVLQVTNTSGSAIDRLELNTVAGPLGGMDILGAKVDGKPVSVNVSGQTILVPFGGVLPKGASATVLIRYRARFPERTGGLSWIFAKADGILAAYRWIPWISRKRTFRNVEVGDPYFTAVSPRLRVSLTFDRPLVIVTNGRQVSADGLTRTFVAEDVRDFNFTAAPDFRRVRGRSPDGQTAIIVYTRTSETRRRQILAWARTAFNAFENQIGRYPYPRYVISEAPGPSGLESPGLSWIGARAIGGSNARFLTIHETGHQWFYAVVGNDQPLEPFADEAVTEFLTRTHMGNFRASRCPTQRLDGSTYAYGDCFYEVVYVQGANFLNGIRADMGASRFWRALRGYWRSNRFSFGGTFELLEALRIAAADAGVNLRPRLRDRFPSLY